MGRRYPRLSLCSTTANFLKGTDNGLNTRPGPKPAQLAALGPTIFRTGKPIAFNGGSCRRLLDAMNPVTPCATTRCTSGSSTTSQSLTRRAQTATPHYSCLPKGRIYDEPSAECTYYPEKSMNGDSDRVAAQGSLEFGRFRVELPQRRLLADNAPIELGRRAFELLLALLEANGSLLTKQSSWSYRAWRRCR
jgi:hypothetical protein